MTFSASTYTHSYISPTQQQPKSFGWGPASTISHLSPFSATFQRNSFKFCFHFLTSPHSFNVYNLASAPSTQRHLLSLCLSSSSGLLNVKFLLSNCHIWLSTTYFTFGSIICFHIFKCHFHFDDSQIVGPDLLLKSHIHISKWLLNLTTWHLYFCKLRCIIRSITLWKNDCSGRTGWLFSKTGYPTNDHR